jgi:carboxymethylenebutenolidase
MMRTFVAASASLALLLLAGPAARADIETKEITIKTGDGDFKAYVAIPDGKGPFPAVVVIQEWWGLNDWIKENAKSFAKKGYVAIAPDLYHGKVTNDPKEAGALIKGLPKDRAMRDLKATVSKLTEMPNVAKGKIGTIGWCMGGMYSLQEALNDDRVKACVICYGQVVTKAEDLKSLKAPVLGVFGEEDKGIPAAGVMEFEKALKSIGTPVEKMNIYKGAGHGFMRQPSATLQNPEYREMQANDAWSQIDAFFAKTLTK